MNNGIKFLVLGLVTFFVAIIALFGIVLVFELYEKKVDLYYFEQRSRIAKENNIQIIHVNK